MSLGSPNKGSNCEGKILAYKKNKYSFFISDKAPHTNKDEIYRYKVATSDWLMNY